VRFTRRVQAVIDQPAFQRLRRVRQLGPTHWVYPGAVHTRFEHSLGAYDYVRRFLISLLRHPAVADSWTEEDLLTVMAAGLCHDIGHYPFAHSLEALHRSGSETPRHEDLCETLIQDDLGAVLEHQWGVDPTRVVRLIRLKHSQQPTQSDRILASILSSAIDADKMDYLQRDSIHMGVPYGQSFDSGRLISALTLNEGENAIAINAKGKVSAEMFIFSRYMMFSEAYWHHAVRAASAMVEAALGDHMARHRPAPADLTRTLLQSSDDDFLRDILHQSPEGSVAQRLLSRLTGDNRELHKRLVTYSRIYAEPEKRDAYMRIYDADSDALGRIQQRISESLAALTGLKVHDCDVLIDTPPRDKDQPESIAVTYGAVRGQRSYPLHQLSRIVAGVHNDFIQVVKKIRIFVAPPLAAKARLQQDAAEVAIMEAILR
jgi:HD superfamily phosphohydrolase